MRIELNHDFDWRENLHKHPMVDGKLQRPELWYIGSKNSYIGGCITLTNDIFLRKNSYFEWN